MSADFRYSKAGYVALNVTEPQRTAEFLQHIFGLSPAGEGPAGELFFRSGMQHHDVVLYRSREAGFRRHGWQMESAEDVERVYQRFERLGMRPRWLTSEESQILGLDLNPAFRVREPSVGICYDYYADMLTLSTPLSVNVTEFEGFLHTGINVPDVRASTEFAVENMGYVVSDYLGNYVGTLVRGWPIPHHHTFAFLPSKSGQPGLNHVAFKVKSIDDIGRYYHRAQANGARIAFGIGRHPTSGSAHTYVFDPDGLSWEYSQGMEQFPEQGYRRARYMSPAPEDFDLWNAIPDPEFGSRGNIDTESK